MERVLRADDVKPGADGLRARWEEMLQEYYLNPTTLDPRYTVEVACPYCRSKEVQECFDLNGFRHNTCSSCHTLYVSPRLSDACIEKLYRDEFYNEVYTRSLIPAFEKRKHFIGRRKYAQTISYCGRGGPGRVLDIGAGIGEVTDVFREEGWSTHVVEMNEIAVQWLRTRGHDEVVHGSWSDYVTPHKYDVIMAWGVVEHVLNPDAFLQRVHELLLPDGLFVSEVPHGQCLLVDMVRKTGMDPKRIVIGEQHIALYSTQAYMSLHERNGLERVHVQTNGLDVDTILKDRKIDVPDDCLASLQECVDERLYGDLLRGFWRRREWNSTRVSINDVNTY